MAIGGILNLCIGEGVTFGPITVRIREKGTGNLVDITGLNVRAKIRKSYGASTDLAVLTTVITDSVNGEIQISLGSDHGIEDNISPLKFSGLEATWPTLVELDTRQKKLFNPGKGPYVWDLEVYDNAGPPMVVRYLTGMVAVTSEVTP